jgi:hypothetical protein
MPIRKNNNTNVRKNRENNATDSKQTDEYSNVSKPRSYYPADIRPTARKMKN